MTYKQLDKYDKDGKLVGKTTAKELIQLYQKVFDEVSNNDSELFVGYIECGFKFFDPKVNESNFRTMCEANWKLLVGFDFVNEEDKFLSLDHYDPLVNKVLKDFPEQCHLKKVYHAGQTLSHKISNIDFAIQAGSVRLGHALNVIQRPQILRHCKHVCIEKNPVSNLLLGYKKDLRQSSTPLLLGLGYPLSISPDDPGKFGY